MTTTYTTTGSVRGNCGHKHRSIATAYACRRRDQAGCASQGGYTDRSVERTDGADLTEQERDELDECRAAMASRGPR